MNLSVAWTSLTLIWVAGEICVAVATRTRRDKGEIHDRGTQLVLWVVIIVSLTAGGFLRDQVPPDLLAHQHWLTLLSPGLIVFGLALRLAAILNLGGNFSANVATRAGQTLNRSGLYAVVRHPSYLGMEIIFLAVGLHSRNLTCLAIDFIPPTLAVLWRIHVEEAALRSRFGEQYIAYSRATKRLLPGIY